MLKEFSHFDPGVIQTIEYVPRISDPYLFKPRGEELNHYHESWEVVKVDSEVNRGGMQQVDFLM